MPQYTTRSFIRVRYDLRLILGYRYSLDWLVLVLAGLLMRPENKEAEAKAEARQCEAEKEAEAKELL